MTGNRIPLLWITGPPGVGKTTVGWQLFTELTRTGRRVGYLDIDQLGMCYPAPASDPERHGIKARNLGAMAASFQAAGAEGVIVSGVVDETHGIRDYVDHIPHAERTMCRLRAEPETLRARLAQRGQTSQYIDAALRDADALDHGDFADVCVDTDGLSPAGVLRLLNRKIGQWPAVPDTSITDWPSPPPFSEPPPAPGSILWLCGARGVGKSTVGWKIFEEVRRAGATAAFVDLEQIGFLRPVPDDDPDNHRIKARNLAALRRTFLESGARHLVVVGPIQRSDALETYAAALPGADLTLCRLHAGPDALRERILRRGQGLGPQLAGEDLAGKPAAELGGVADRAAATAEQLHQDGIGDLVVDTNARTVEEAARAVMDRVEGWPASDTSR